MAQQQEAVTINMGDLSLGPNAVASPPASKKKQDTLFGPNIGIVARGPEWTESREKVIDELTPEVVRAWIAKSKEVSRPSRLPYTAALCLLAPLVHPAWRLRIRMLRWMFSLPSTTGR